MTCRALWSAMTRSAVVSALGAVLLWSTVATAFKLTLAHSSPVELVALSTAAATVLLGVVVILSGRLRSALDGVRRYPRRTLLGAALNPTAYYLVLLTAYDRLPAQVAQPLNYTWALTLSVLAAVTLKRKLTARDVLCGLICYAGVVVVCRANGDAGGRVDVPGIALALGSTFLWATYWLINAADPREPVDALFAMFLLGLPMTLACWWLDEGVRVPAIPSILGATYVGFVEMGLAFVLWSRAMRLTRHMAGIAYLIFLSPFLSLVFIGGIVGEHIRLGTLVGLSLIVMGLILQQAGRRRMKAPPADRVAA